MNNTPDLTLLLNRADIVRMTLTRVAKERALPFELTIPSPETRKAMEESRAMMKARNARFTDAQELFNALDVETAKR